VDPVIRRIVVPLALILLAGVIVWPLRSLFDAFLESRSLAWPITWTLRMTWAFDFAWSLILGAILGVVLRSRMAMVWAAAAGLIYGGINFAMTRHHLSSDLALSVSAGIYGQYAIACVGALVGAWLAIGALAPDKGASTEESAMG
jgi:hypothetical protein